MLGGSGAGPPAGSNAAAFGRAVWVHRAGLRLGKRSPTLRKRLPAPDPARCCRPAGHACQRVCHAAHAAPPPQLQPALCHHVRAGRGQRAQHAQRTSCCWASMHSVRSVMLGQSAACGKAGPPTWLDHETGQDKGCNAARCCGAAAPMAGYGSRWPQVGAPAELHVRPGCRYWGARETDRVSTSAQDFLKVGPARTLLII